jgi:transposase
MPSEIAVGLRPDGRHKPRNCHPSAAFHLSGLTGARDIMAAQIVMDHTGDTRHRFDPADLGAWLKLRGVSRN